MPRLLVILVLCILVQTGCSHSSHTADPQNALSRSQPADQTAAGQIVLKKMHAGQEFSGFLQDYSKLKPNPNVGDNTLTYVRADAQKNLRRYIDIIVDPVQVYLASDVDDSKLPDKARGVAPAYFHKALVDSASTAFPEVNEPGPLVLRLRTAIIGVDVGGEIPAMFTLRPSRFRNR